MLEIKKLKIQNAGLLINASNKFYNQNISKEFAKSFLSNPNNFYYLAFFDNMIASFVSGYYLDIWQNARTEIFVYDVETLPEFRRKGVAKQIINKVLEDGKKLGYHDSWVLTESDNIPAINLYSKFGGGKKDQIMIDLCDPSALN